MFNKRVPLSYESLDLFASVVTIIASSRLDFAIQKIGTILLLLFFF
jgi:hypothetical protein